MAKRSTYSHRGCTNCKKSRIKCIEGDPACTNCARRGLKCEYKYNLFLYQPDPASKRKKNRFKQVDVDNDPAIGLTSKFIPSSPFALGAVEQSIDRHRVDFHVRSPKSPVPGDDLGCREMDERSIANLMTIPSWASYWKSYDLNRFLELESRLDAKGENHQEVHYHETTPDILEFIFHAFNRTKCVHNFMLIIDKQNNPVTEWFLYFSRRYSIIGFTINTIVANMLDVRCEDDRWRCILQRNISATLTNISQSLGDCKSFPEMACHLLCIMFLFSERSASRLDAWRLHLKGAYAILEKCDSLYSDLVPSLDTFDLELKYATEMYAFTRTWYVASESIACLSAPNGGAIGNPVSMRKCLNYDTTGHQNSFVIGGYNLIKGYSQRLTPVFTDIIEYMMVYKATEGVSLSGCEAFFHEIIVTPRGLALGKRLLKIIADIESEKIDFLMLDDHSKRATMRACNTCFISTLRILIYLYLYGKPSSSLEVQHCVQIIEEQLVTIRNIKTYGLCIHLPLFIGAMCADGRARRNFFDTIQAISDNGTYVALNTIERLKNYWARKEDVGATIRDDLDCITL